MKQCFKSKSRLYGILFCFCGDPRDDKDDTEDIGMNRGEKSTFSLVSEKNSPDHVSVLEKDVYMVSCSSF